MWVDRCSVYQRDLLNVVSVMFFGWYCSVTNKGPMHYEVGLSRSLCVPVNDIVVGLLFFYGYQHYNDICDQKQRWNVTNVYVVLVSGVYGT